MVGPYRTAANSIVEFQPGAFWRAWYWLFGRLVYGGEETCGHCKFWTPGKEKVKVREWSDFFNTYVDRKKTQPTSKGDCKLIFSHDGKEKTKDDTCGRFKARRKYKHRIRS